jgi:prepilin-type N-terminal cleavage/methylation domain-containing protein
MNRPTGVTETLRASNAGFTLLELLTVLAISALIFCSWTKASDFRSLPGTGNQGN